MIPKFKYYFYPFLKNLSERDNCRLYDLAKFISKDLKLTSQDLNEYTKSGRVTKHSSRINYCASYLKRMGLVEAFSVGSYQITERGKEVLGKYGEDLTLESLRELPEFLATQVNADNTDVVYVKPHKRGDKMIGPYFCHKKLLKEQNPNIEKDVTNSYRSSLMESKDADN